MRLKGIDLLGISQAKFARPFKGSPKAVPVLAGALDHLEPLIRGHSASALRSIAGEHPIQALRGKVEEDERVDEEIQCVLSEMKRREIAATISHASPETETAAGTALGLNAHAPSDGAGVTSADRSAVGRRLP